MTLVLNNDDDRYSPHNQRLSDAPLRGVIMRGRRLQVQAMGSGGEHDPLGLQTAGALDSHRWRRRLSMRSILRRWSRVKR